MHLTFIIWLGEQEGFINIIWEWLIILKAQRTLFIKKPGIEVY